MWHVSSRSGVATLRTAIHFLLTCLLTCVFASAAQQHAAAAQRLCECQHTELLFLAQQRIAQHSATTRSVCVNGRTYG